MKVSLVMLCNNSSERLVSIRGENLLTICNRLSITWHCAATFFLGFRLMKSGINPFDSQEAKPYKNDSEILAMTNLVSSYQNNDINEFETILKQNRRNIMDDPFIREHIEGGYIHVMLIILTLCHLTLSVCPDGSTIGPISSCFDCASIVINRWQSCALLQSFLDQRMHFIS